MLLWAGQHLSRGDSVQGAHSSDQLGKDLSRAEFDKVGATVRSWQRGFREGSILTSILLTMRDTGRTCAYVRQVALPDLQGYVMSWDIQTRTAYACLSCQPLRAVQEAPPSPKKTKKRPAAATPTKAKKAKAGPTPVKRFRSHCVEDAAVDISPEMLTVKELKAKLSALRAPRTAQVGARRAVGGSVEPTCGRPRTRRPTARARASLAVERSRPPPGKPWRAAGRRVVRVIGVCAGPPEKDDIAQPARPALRRDARGIERRQARAAGCKT